MYGHQHLTIASSVAAVRQRDAAERRIVGPMIPAPRYPRLDLVGIAAAVLATVMLLASLPVVAAVPGSTAAPAPTAAPEPSGVADPRP